MSLPMLRLLTSLGGHLGQCGDVHILVGEMFKEFLGSLRDIASSREHEDQWAQRAWHIVESNFVAAISKGIYCHVEIAIVVGETDMLKKTNIGRE
jgi:hypothetical protein